MVPRPFPPVATISSTTRKDSCAPRSRRGPMEPVPSWTTWTATVSAGPVRFQVTATIEDDTFTADFSGTDPQVRGALNSTRSFTCGAVAVCVRCAMSGDVPNTAGMFRPLNIITEPGTVADVVMPGASSMRGVTGFRMVDTIFGAMAGLLPHRIPAAGEGGNTLVVFGGRHPDRSAYIYYESLTGTWGGRPGMDGNDGLCNPIVVASNIPVEQAEAEYPVRIRRYGLVGDTGGPGKYRGGLAVEREWELLEGETHLAIRSDRRDHLPYGLHSGKPGKGSINVLYRKDGSREVLPVMISTTMKAGEVLYHRQPGGRRMGRPVGAVSRVRTAGREEPEGFAPVRPGRLRRRLGFGGLPDRRESSGPKVAAANGVKQEKSIRCVAGPIRSGKCRSRGRNRRAGSGIVTRQSCPGRKSGGSSPAGAEC